MTYDVQHLFICLSAIHVSSLVRCLFGSFVHFSIRLFTSLSLSFKKSSYILGNSPSWDYVFCKYFLPVCACLLILLMSPIFHDHRNATMNAFIWFSLLTCIKSFSKVGTSKWNFCSEGIFTFKFTRYCKTIFQMVFKHSHQATVTSGVVY